MGKSRIVVLIWTLVALFIVGCGGTAAPSATPAIEDSPSYQPVTVTDSRGQIVTVTDRPTRIVSLSPAHTEILYALGAGDLVVARDSFSDYPEEAKSKPAVGDAFTLNLEALVSLEPDLVYATFEGPVADVERLGIRVLYLEPAADIDGVLDNILLLGRIMDRQVQAKELVASIDARIGEVRRVIDDVEIGPRIYYEIDPGLWTVGPDSFVGSALALLKAQNVAEGATSPYPQLSSEVIVSRDPELVILGDSREYLSTGITIEDVGARPGWGGVTAVVEGRVYPFDDSLLSRPGPRIAEGIEQLGRLLYPELFE